MTGECVCGSPETAGVSHRTDGPCYQTHLPPGRTMAQVAEWIDNVHDEYRNATEDRRAEMRKEHPVLAAPTPTAEQARHIARLLRGPGK